MSLKFQFYEVPESIDFINPCVCVCVCFWGKCYKKMRIEIKMLAKIDALSVKVGIIE